MPAQERTARAAIRDEALRLFAEYGVDAVSLRRVAATAGVAPSLVVHHFGGKDGLRAAVDDHVTRVCDGLFDSAFRPDPARILAEGLPPSFAATLLRRLPPGSPVPAYVRRLLLGDDQAGVHVFRHWYQAKLALVDALVDAGAVRPGGDRVVRAAFLAVNDLAALLLRTQLVRVLGVDPLAAESLSRWADEAGSVYRDGLLLRPGTG